jgi:hypothetical protein
MSEPKPSWDEDGVTIRLLVTLRQLWEINRRAGLDVSDGRARGEYIVGCALGEPHDNLLERVQRVAAEQRAQFRAELDAERQKREGSQTRAATQIALLCATSHRTP